MARRRSREEWAAVLGTLEESGEPLAKFCERRGLSVRTVMWWRWQLRKKRWSTALSRRESVRIVPVDVVGLSSALPNAVRIALGDMELRVEVGTDVGYVGSLVGALRRC